MVSISFTDRNSLWTSVVIENTILDCMAKDCYRRLAVCTHEDSSPLKSVPNSKAPRMSQ
jgi:hypothetical protein